MTWLSALRAALPVDGERCPTPTEEGGVHHSPPPPSQVPDRTVTCTDRGSDPGNGPSGVDSLNPLGSPRSKALLALPSGNIIDAGMTLIAHPDRPGEVTTPLVLLANGWARQAVLDLLEPSQHDDEPEDEEDDPVAEDRRGLDERIRWALERLDQAPVDAPVVVAALARSIATRFGAPRSTARRLARQARDLHQPPDPHRDPSEG